MISSLKTINSSQENVKRLHVSNSLHYVKRFLKENHCSTWINKEIVLRNELHDYGLLEKKNE